MARQSIILLNDTSGTLNLVGPQVNGVGYYSSGGASLQTIAVYVTNFSGRLYISGSIANPDSIEDSDWFYINYANTSPGTYYVQFPQNPSNPTGEDGGDSGVLTFSFNGNFTFLRAEVDRGYLSGTNPYQYGSISQILLNY